jgi:hypothetical protein
MKKHSSRYVLQRKTPGFDWSNVASRRRTPKDFIDMEKAYEDLKAQGQQVRVVRMLGDVGQTVLLHDSEAK